MKKIIIPAFVLVSLAIACGKPVNPSGTTTATPAEKPAEATAEVKTDPIKTAELEKENAHTAMLEAGKAIYNGKCARCHAAKPVDNWNAAQWQPILKSMIPKAKLDSLSAEQVRAYVNEFSKK